MWISEAQTLLKGLLLWLMDSGRPFTIGEIAHFIKGTPDFAGALEEIRDHAINADGTININSTAFININNFLNKAEKEQSGVKSTITARLNLWDDPLIQAATESSDFDIRDMRRTRMTIYLGMPVDQLKRLAPLMNLFIQLFLSKMTRCLPQKDEPFKVIVTLDEFCALGRMDVLKEGFGFLAGYNVHLTAIIQNIGQFYDLYGGRDKSDVFLQNTDYKIAYRQNTKTDRDLVSELLGNHAIKNLSRSFHHGVVGFKHAGSSESYISKPLLSADQVRTFSAEQGIVIFNGQAAIKYNRIIFYNDKRFANRVLLPLEIEKVKIYSNPLIVKKTLQIFDNIELE